MLGSWRKLGNPLGIVNGSGWFEREAVRYIGRVVLGGLRLGKVELYKTERRVFA